MFNARVHGVRAEAGKLIYDVDVDGQKSSPWTYREFPRREDMWGLNIHTTGEERDNIVDAIVDYQAGNPDAKRVAFEAAKAQVIPLQANALCLRCAKTSIAVTSSHAATCGECGAKYALASSSASIQY
jgi:hypothetical protein